MFQVKTQEASVSSPSLLVGVSWGPGRPPSPLPLLSRDLLTTSAPCSQPSCSAPAPSSSSSAPIQTENAGISGSLIGWRNISVEWCLSECWWMFVLLDFCWLMIVYECERLSLFYYRNHLCRCSEGFCWGHQLKCFLSFIWDQSEFGWSRFMIQLLIKPFFFLFHK